MKTVHFLLLLIALCLPFAAQAAGIYRNFIWGAGPQDVREFEKAILYGEEDNSISFLEDKNGRRTIIYYDFTDNKLWRIRVEYFELHEANPQMILDLIMDEQKELTKIFGTPSKENMIWKDKTYRNYPQFWHRAFGGRDMRIETEWKTDAAQVHFESYRNKEDQKYTLSYTVEDPAVAATLEAAKTQDPWKTP